MSLRRIKGDGWLALIGGGEFSFGETLEVDRAWLAKADAADEALAVGFLPTASGSVDYAHHFSTYLDEAFERRMEVIPVYRGRDARRQKNVDRLGATEALYLGGGVTETLLEVVAGSPVGEALERRLEAGGVVAAIAAAAQALGAVSRGLGGSVLDGLDWLPATAVETNFTPAHDRRLRELLSAPGVETGLGIAAGSALLLGPGGEVEIVGSVFKIEGADGDIEPLTTDWKSGDN
jgi:putative intracellular protease/amidase